MPGRQRTPDMWGRKDVSFLPFNARHRRVDASGAHTKANHRARVRKPGPPGLGACTAIQQQRTRQPPSLVARNSAQPATPAARYANGVSYMSGSADRDDAIDMQGAAVFYNVCLAFSGKQRA
uniref:hypothetical protein n=1 Tax=Cupriavidus yeoncheonensis TaxID=1462994 RepID=UPI003F493E6F